MTVFELVLYACLTTGHQEGGAASLTKSCEWRQDGSLYSTEAKCRTAAEGAVGTEVFGDSYGLRSVQRYELARCAELTVN